MAIKVNLQIKVFVLIWLGCQSVTMVGFMVFEWVVLGTRKLKSLHMTAPGNKILVEFHVMYQQTVHFVGIITFLVPKQ